MNLVTLKDWSAEEVAKVLEVSLAMKADPERFDGTMQGKNLALRFQKTSTRTRYSSEIGMLQLGGQAVYLDWDVTNFGLADLGDEIQVLSLYSDLMLIRLLKHADVLKATSASRVPVMNGCCDRSTCITRSRNAYCCGLTNLILRANS